MNIETYTLTQALRIIGLLLNGTKDVDQSVLDNDDYESLIKNIISKIIPIDLSNFGLDLSNISGSTKINYSDISESRVVTSFPRIATVNGNTMDNLNYPSFSSIRFSSASEESISWSVLKIHFTLSEDVSISSITEDIPNNIVDLSLGYTSAWLSQAISILLQLCGNDLSSYALEAILFLGYLFDGYPIIGRVNTDNSSFIDLYIPYKCNNNTPGGNSLIITFDAVDDDDDVYLLYNPTGFTFTYNNVIHKILAGDNSFNINID